MSIKFVAVKQVPLDQLTTFPGNAWKPGQVELIRESLREHGQFRSILVRSVKGGPDVVLAGNHTYRAMVEENMGAVRCEVITCTDQDAVKLNLADNRYEQIGDRDKVELAELIAQLEGDYSGTGYDPDTADDLLALLEGEELAEIGPTGARYVETPEQEAERRALVDTYKPRPVPEGAAAVAELIIVLPLDEHTEATQLIQKARREAGSEATSGDVVMAALRAYYAVEATAPKPDAEGEA